MTEECPFAEPARRYICRLEHLDAVHVAFVGADVVNMRESIADGVVVGFKTRTNRCSCGKSSAETAVIQVLRFSPQCSVSIPANAGDVGGGGFEMAAAGEDLSESHLPRR
ncbi:hypothetical protein EP51_42925 (plasmid) [Rhodococcus opacus]|uniref:Uncharacterized protein n=1 Tax=Rhodococcus opacus TaxID=37919 RepID=A0A076F5F5_RHOOP|nr:hypothetical protein EP51_42925 [Rhodococcus opacus]